MDDNVQIRAIPPRIQYIADGQSTEFEFPFAIFKPTNLRVYFGDVLQHESTYTVSKSAENDGGAATLATPPPADTVVTLLRDLAIERTTCFQEGGTLRAAALNYELDFQIACQQQIADTLNRAMTLPPYAVNADVNLMLPTPKAGKAIIWNEAGTNLENSEVEINAVSRELDEKVETAAEKAAICVQKADEATTQATTAAEQAGIATQKAAEIIEAIENKANADLDNLSPAGKSYASGLGMPSNRYLDLTLGSSGSSYTAPANGYFCVATGSNLGNIRLFVSNGLKAMFTPQTSIMDGFGYIPCLNGQVITYMYNTAITFARFIYAEGDAL